MGYDTARAVKRFYDTASKAEASALEAGLMLTDRQRKVLDMYYHRGACVGFIADTLGFSQLVICKELARIRQKLCRLDGARFKT